MVIAKVRRTGNYNYLKSNGKSVEIIGICGISTSPINLPLIIVASIIKCYIIVTIATI